MLTDIIEACRIGKAVVDWLKSGLTEDEKDILIAAATSGVIQYVECDCGDCIITDTKQFDSESDPELNERYIAAFEQLCGRGLVRHRSDTLFGLSAKGFEVARGLLSTIDAKSNRLST